MHQSSASRSSVSTEICDSFSRTSFYTTCNDDFGQSRTHNSWWLTWSFGGSNLPTCWSNSAQNTLSEWLDDEETLEFFDVFCRKCSEQSIEVKRWFLAWMTKKWKNRNCSARLLWKRQKVPEHLNRCSLLWPEVRFKMLLSRITYHTKTFC